MHAVRALRVRLRWRCPLANWRQSRADHGRRALLMLSVTLTAIICKAGPCDEQAARRVPARSCTSAAGARDTACARYSVGACGGNDEKRYALRRRQLRPSRRPRVGRACASSQEVRGATRLHTQRRGACAPRRVWCVCAREPSERRAEMRGWEKGRSDGADRGGRRCGHVRPSAAARVCAARSIACAWRRCGGGARVR
jgi:hypothetical protein